MLGDQIARDGDFDQLDGLALSDLAQLGQNRCRIALSASRHCDVKLRFGQLHTRARRALEFAWLLYAVEVAFLAAWFGVHWWYRHPTTHLIAEEAALFAALLGALTAVFWIWTRWQGARIAREAAAFAALAAEAGGNDQGS